MLASSGAGTDNAKLHQHRYLQSSFAAQVGDEKNSSAHSLLQHAPPSSPFMPELNNDTYDSEDEHDHKLHAPINKAEVTLAFKRLKRRKAAGIDGIRAEYMLDAEDLLFPPLCMTSNQMLHAGVPEHWCMGVIHPILKGGDPTDPDNYRGIMVTTVLFKLFAMVLEARMAAWAEGKMLRADGQARFRKDHRTTDHLFAMNALINNALANKRKLYCCFVDFRKAFDSIPRSTMWDVLESKGLSGPTLAAIQSMYEKDKARVLMQEGLTESFTCSKGVMQGCPASQWLFGLYLDELDETIQLLKTTLLRPLFMIRFCQFCCLPMTMHCSHALGKVCKFS